MGDWGIYQFGEKNVPILLKIIFKDEKSKKHLSKDEMRGVIPDSSNICCTILAISNPLLDFERKKSNSPIIMIYYYLHFP